MGTWGEGNLDSDAALDFVHCISLEARKELRAPECFEDIALVMAGVEVDKTLIKYCYASPPEREGIVALRDVVLEVYDAEVEEMSGGPEFDKKRRRIIKKTFADYLKVIDAWYE